MALKFSPRITGPDNKWSSNYSSDLLLQFRKARFTKTRIVCTTWTVAGSAGGVLWDQKELQLGSVCIAPVFVLSIAFMSSRVRANSWTTQNTWLSDFPSTVKHHHRLPGCLLQVILKIWIVDVDRLGSQTNCSGGIVATSLALSKLLCNSANLWD